MHSFPSVWKYLNEAELPPVEGAVYGWDGGDGQEGEEPQAHDPEGEVHFHPPHLLLIPGVLHIGVDLQTAQREGEGGEALPNTDRSNQVRAYVTFPASPNAEEGSRTSSRYLAI